MDINNKARSSLINTNGVIESNFAPGPDAMQVGGGPGIGVRRQPTAIDATDHAEVSLL